LLRPYFAYNGSSSITKPLQLPIQEASCNRQLWFMIEISTYPLLCQAVN